MKWCATRLKAHYLKLETLSFLEHVSPPKYFLGLNQYEQLSLRYTILIRFVLFVSAFPFSLSQSFFDEKIYFRCIPGPIIYLTYMVGAVNALWVFRQEIANRICLKQEKIILMRSQTSPNN